MLPISTMSLRIDAEQPLVLAGFWAEVFRVPVAPGSSEGSASLIPSAHSVQLVFDRTDEPVVLRNRIRLQLVTEDFDEQVQRLLDCGAAFAAVGPESAGSGSVELLDPEGNEFTVHARTRLP
jgi:predicted enzyme related to lactoylglutathione lyase